MLMLDHVPQIDGRDPSGVAFAYCYGYIQALLDALVPREGRDGAYSNDLHSRTQATRRDCIGVVSGGHPRKGQN